MHVAGPKNTIFGCSFRSVSKIVSNFFFFFFCAIFIKGQIQTATYTHVSEKISLQVGVHQ